MIQSTPDFFVCTGCGDAVRICEHHRRDGQVLAMRKRLMESGHRKCSARKRERPLPPEPPTSKRQLQSIVLGIHEREARRMKVLMEGFAVRMAEEMLRSGAYESPELAIVPRALRGSGTKRTA